MIYYNPREFYHILFSVRGSVIPSCIPHALPFAAIGGGAAYMAHRGILQEDVNEVSLVCGLVMSLLLSFRLTFSFNRYEEALLTVASLQGTCRRLMARCCSCLPPDDPEAVAVARRVHRWLSLSCVLCKARVRADAGQERDTIEPLVALGLISEDERRMFEANVEFAAVAAGGAAAVEVRRGQTQSLEAAAASARSDRFPSKARVALVAYLLWSELSRLLRDGKLHPQQYAALEADVQRLSDLYSKLDAMAGTVLPFSYANYIKFVLVVYIASFPFGVAVTLGWLTPAVTFLAALIFLAIDRVGAIMDTPFCTDQAFGIDLEKRIRRTDKETAALLGTWLQRPVPHFDLFPETARSNLARHLRRDAVDSDSSCWPWSWRRKAKPAAPCAPLLAGAAPSIS